MENASIHSIIPEVVAGSNLVIAATGNPGVRVEKHIKMPPHSPKFIKQLLTGESASVSILFRREDKGLSNDELKLCDIIMSIPTSPDYSSMNLSHAVAVVLYFCIDDKESDLAMEFKNVKGPDFISLLRGYVNVLGPNSVDSDDTVFIIRRAILLRSLLERTAKHLFEDNNHLGIDDGVLRALIKVPNYKHGARSMEAIVEMSMLTERVFWEQACLPAKEQLILHVDEEIFSRLVIRDVLLGAANENIAKTIHEKYLEDQEGNKPASDPSMQPWEKLTESLKESNRRQADHIPEKLRTIGCGFAPVVNREPEIFEFMPDEIEVLAEMEHERWVSERLLNGWIIEEKKDVENKISPYLIPWSDLIEEIKEWDRQTIRRLPELLAKAKFKIYRLH